MGVREELSAYRANIGHHLSVNIEQHASRINSERGVPLRKREMIGERVVNSTFRKIEMFLCSL